MSEMDMEDSEYKAKQLRFEYSTDELIAELEKRRPCQKCSIHEYEYCTKCVFGPKKINNNFKEAA